MTQGLDLRSINLCFIFRIIKIWLENNIQKLSLRKYPLKHHKNGKKKHRMLWRSTKWYIGIIGNNIIGKCRYTWEKRNRRWKKFLRNIIVLSKFLIVTKERKLKITLSYEHYYDIIKLIQIYVSPIPFSSFSLWN